jgi:hypothetical protein
MRPFHRNTVELPGPGPFSQAPQLTILRLPQSVYIPMIVGAGWISNEFPPEPGSSGTMGVMTDLHALVIYVPGTHTQQVLKAIGDAGAGRIGNYSHCSYVSPGTGRFTAHDGAAPYLGRVGAPEEVPEERIECVVERPALPAVVAALRAAHPYEEPAFMSWQVEGWRQPGVDSSQA